MTEPLRSYTDRAKRWKEVKETYPADMGQRHRCPECGQEHYVKREEKKVEESK